MSGVDNLSPVLFHGTLHQFAPGDVVNPTDTEHTEQPMAYATADLGHAAAVARAKARMHNRRNPDEPRSPLVYEVEHMGKPAEIWGSRHAADPQGFRVKREVSY